MALLVLLFACAAALLLFSSSSVGGLTNDEDVYALNTLYTSINSPALTGWVANGGDPCAELWQGVACAGPNITKLNLTGLSLTGELGYALGNLTTLIVLDLSNNIFSGAIPIQLPLHVQQLILCNNHFTGSFPYSVADLSNLVILNISNNLLSGAIPDVFFQSGTLNTLDLSTNSFYGPLPPSFGDMSSLNTLYLQNNQLNGTIDILADLPLKDVDISNNSFTGWVPPSLSSLPSFKDSGNQFSAFPAPAPPPPPSSHGSYSRGPGQGSSPTKGEMKSHSRSERFLTQKRIVGIVVAGTLVVAMAVLAVLFLAWQCCGNSNDVEKYKSGSSWQGLLIPPAKDEKEKSKLKSKASLPQMVTLKPPPIERYGVMSGKNAGSRPTHTRSMRNCVSATAYSVAELQSITNSFGQENLLGEGSLGWVYKAELPDGKLLAVKKLEISVSMLQNEDVVDILSNISRLRHTNILGLVGYCMEHGQFLLVYDYVSKGTLHDILHSGEENSGRLSWSLRVKIALGAARALEYLHEESLPPVVHGNFKSANILLDDDYNPLLSDCGISSLTTFGLQHQVSTQHLGSFGYNAPESTMSGAYTAKSDVYSFGVVMLELMTGRKPIDRLRPRGELSLVRWATPQLYDIDALAKMVDPALGGIYPAKSLSRFADVIALCVQPEPEFRPPMSEVVQSLECLMQ